MKPLPPCAPLLAAAWLTTCFVHPATAQDMPGGAVDPTRAPSSTRLDRVDVISRQQSDTDLRRRSQVAKQIYGREEMDKYGDSNVADVLKRLPGVSVQGGAARMRGLGSGYTLILINGDPAPPGFALDQLSPAQVERIEVTKGPTADQSAQAVAGAINIILKEAPRVSQRDLRLSSGYNTHRPTGSANFTFGERLGALSLSLPVSVFQWRGLNTLVNTRDMLGTDGLPSAAIQRGQQLFWGHGMNTGPRLNWRLSEDETLSLQSFLQKGYWNNRVQYQNEVLKGLASLDDDAQTHGTWQNARGNLQWTNYLSASQRIELKAGVQASKGTYDSQTYRLQAPQRHTVGATEDRSLTQAGKYTRLLNDQHSLTVGWDLEWRQRDERREVTENGRPQLQEFEGQPFSARVERQAWFAQDEWEISKQWSGNIGIRAERIGSQSRGAATPIDNASRVLTPLLHLTYKLDGQGKDLIRASLTRSYKAPELSALMARPSLNGLFPDPNRPNTELSPDREGNPSLKPELATGLDASFEKYLPAGGLISVGLFHRNVNNLIRSVTTLETVSWASVPRWVSKPRNFSQAQTSGLELEVKGRAGELVPALFDPKLALNLRGALSFYRSRVEALPGPNNRLDSQPPWSGNFGFDHRFASAPLTVGATLVFTPGYATQQTASQLLDQSRGRTLDVFGQWTFSRTAALRVSANNLAPLETLSQTLLASGDSSTAARRARTNFGVALELKL
ncbi:MAG: TonB-dependent receptor [Rhodoferax sp.]|nr:TonB-dependent receptor [Rhodoferax sp.]